MRTLHAATELQANQRPVSLAIGFFDGVHLGHQRIITETVSAARQHRGLALVVTFDRHPNTTVAPDRVPALIYPLDKKIRTIKSFGPDALLLLAFTKALSEVPGEQFVRRLVHDLGNVQGICVGANFVFGRHRDGNVALLRKLGAEFGFIVTGVPSVEAEGHVVSSTRIRRAIHSGHLDLAGRMLGRPYSLVANVVRGDGLGRQLGFPTANLDTAGLVLPPSGVYAGQTRIGSDAFISVLNIGTRPTLNRAVPQLRTEVHILNFHQNLYDTQVEVILGPRLRDERRFSGLAELQAQIRRDIEAARMTFEGKAD